MVRKAVAGSRLLLGILLTVWMSSALYGADKLSLRTTGYLVKTTITEKGERTEELLPLTKSVLPGTVIAYHITARNQSGGALQNIDIRGKVPKGTVYMPGSASVNVMFSIDGGKTYHKEPVKYKTVDQATGETVEKIAPVSMYTDLRWRVAALPAAGEKGYDYRVEVVGE